MKLLPNVHGIGVITKTRFLSSYSQYQTNQFHILADNQSSTYFRFFRSKTTQDIRGDSDRSMKKDSKLKLCINVKRQQEGIRMGTGGTQTLLDGIQARNIMHQVAYSLRIRKCCQNLCLFSIFFDLNAISKLIALFCLQVARLCSRKVLGLQLLVLF